MIPIYLINLDKNVDRLHFVGSRLNALGINFQRISAVHGASMAPEEKKAFLTKVVTEHSKKRDWHDGQIGCFLSHFNIWEKIVQENIEYALVVEDDVHISDGLAEVLADISWIPEDADIVRLNSSTNYAKYKTVKKIINNKYAVKRVLSTVWTTDAYIISNKAARKILADKPSNYLPSDSYLFCYETSEIAKQLNTYALKPALFKQDKFQANNVLNSLSDIENNIKNASYNKLTNISNFSRLKSKLYKLCAGYEKI